MITRDGDWTPEERVALESQLLQATQGPLCLDPSPSVSVSASRARHQGLQLSSAPLRRVARKFSQARSHHYVLFPNNPLGRVCAPRRFRSRSDPQCLNDKLELDIVGMDNTREQETEENNHLSNGWSMQHHFKSNATRCKSY